MSTHSISPQQDQQRQDQIVHRFYIKTVEVLTEARLSIGNPNERRSSGREEDTHNGAGKGKKEPRIDKWFNLPLPDPEVFRPDLEAYRSLSTSFPATTSTPYAIVPPLLIAFILDVSDLPSKHALVYRRGSEGAYKVSEPGSDTYRLDLPSEAVKDKGKERAGGGPKRSQGIVLERWTLRSLQIPSDPTPATSTSTSPLNSISSSSTFIRPAHPRFSDGGKQAAQTPYPSSSTSYKSGIIHFRSLYQYVRLLPAYKVFRRLRRGGSAAGNLRVGVKLWSADGFEEEWVREGGTSDHGTDEDDSEDDRPGRRSPTYRKRTPEEGLAEAWKTMEHGLIGLDRPLSSFSSPISGPLGKRRDEQVDPLASPEKLHEYEFPTLPLSHGLFSLSVQAREEVDIWAEDVESILSSALAGIDLQSKKQDAEGVDMGQLDLEEEYFTPTLTARRKASTASTPVPDFASLGHRGASPDTNIPLDRASPGETGVVAGRPSHDTLTTALPAKPQRPRRVISESQVGSGAGIGMDARPGSVGGQSFSPAHGGGLAAIAADVGDLPFARPSSRQGIPVTTPSGAGERPRTASSSGQFSTSPLAGLGIARRGSQLAHESGTFTSTGASSSLGNRSSPLAMGIRTGNNLEAREYSSQRMSPYLSSSGRSFSLLNESRPRLSSIGSQPGTSPSRSSFRGPSNLSPTSGSIPRSAIPSRPNLTGHHSTPTPPIPEYHEEDGGPGIPVPAAPQSLKRYSSSFGQRRPSFTLGATPGAASSNASSLDPGSLLGAGGHSMSRTNTRLSSSSRPPSFSNAPDKGDINMFLKTLESMPRPPSLASTAQSRAYLPSTSSSLSNPRHSVLAGGPVAGGSPGDSGPSSGADSMVPGAGSAFMRKRMTKAEVDAALNRMAGSYTLAAQPFAQPGGGPLTGSALATSSSVSPIDRLVPSALRSSSYNRPAPLSVSDRNDQTPTSSEQAQRTFSQTTSTRDVGFVTRLGSSVKSSSPLAQAPIQASPMESYASAQASDHDQYSDGDQQGQARLAQPSHRPGRSDPRPEPFNLPQEQLRHQASERNALTLDRHVQSLPGNSHEVSLSRNHSLPPPLPSTSASGDSASTPIPIDNDRDSRRRAPVLQRGGFNQLMSSSRDHTSGPAIGISSVSVGRSAETPIGAASPVRKISRSVPARDTLVSPKVGGQTLLPLQTTSPASPRASLKPGILHADHAELREERPDGLVERVSKPNSVNYRTLVNHPHLIRALSAGPMAGRSTSIDDREYASQDESESRLARNTVKSHDRGYPVSSLSTPQPCVTAPASFDERKRVGANAELTRRWASGDEPTRNCSSSGRTQSDNEDNDESVVGDLEMSDCNR